MQDRKRARELAAEFSRKDDPTGWFDVLYREAEEGKSTVPWADYHPTPVIGFWMQYPQQAAGKSALVAGCGLGAAAAQHARWGFCRSEEHTSELQSRLHLVCRLLLEKKKQRSAYWAIRDRSNHKMGLVSLVT